MKTVYCDDIERRKWALGHEHFCDGDPAKCGYTVKVGKQVYCGYRPGRCALHQVIKSQAGCLFCVNYTKKWTCSVCVECLSAESRVNYRQEPT